MRKWLILAALLGGWNWTGLDLFGFLAAPEERASTAASSATVSERVPEPEREAFIFEENDVEIPGFEDLASLRKTDGFAKNLQNGAIITGSAKQRVLLFTFDDGPDAHQTPILLDALDRAGVKGVFFLTATRFTGIGPRIERETELAREIVRRGHVIGSHGFEHIHLTALSSDEVLKQVDRAAELFETRIGARPWLIRPPFGRRDARIDGLLESRGYTTMLWNLGTGDVQVRTPQDTLVTFVKVLRQRERESGDRGGIVLLHDIHEWSIEAFPLIIDWIRRKNCMYLENGEELYDILDDPAVFYSHRQSTGQVAPSVELPPHVWRARQAHTREAAQRFCDSQE